MTKTFDSYAKEFINEAWCYFLNNITTLDFPYTMPDEANHTPLPHISNITEFINNSSTTLLKSLEELSEELSLHGMIDEENNLTWGNTVIDVKEPQFESTQKEPHDESDEDDESDDTHEEPEEDEQKSLESISYIESTTTSEDSEESSEDENQELRQEMYDEPIRASLIAAFPPAARMAEYELDHLTRRLKIIFEKLVKEGL